MEKLSAKLVEVVTGDEHHTVFQCPDRLPDNITGAAYSNPFNMVMIDVSGSMWSYFHPILQYWNEIIAPILTGETKIYVFGSEVYFRRNGKFLEESDMLNQSTNLTDAIKVIRTEFEKSTEAFNRLFLVTDGHHNATATSPEVEIANLYIPSGKTIEVYLLGVDCSFPVEYSLTIRSALHNGNANVPSLFWAEDGSEESIHEQILSMADVLKKGNIKLKIAPDGYLTPGLPSTDTCYLGEHLYFPISASEILSSLKLSTEEGSALDLEVVTETGDLRYFLDKVFCQWNSLLIQQHRRKEHVPIEAFEIMEKIFSNFMAKLKADLEGCDLTSVRGRLQKKTIKSYQTEFDTMMNQSKAVIEIEGKFESELELAKSILKTTVKSKYDMKNLRMKGHGTEDYAEDMTAFRGIYEGLRGKIMSLPEPSVDECCRVTLGSFVKDLQDPYFEELLQEDKFTFMKTVSVTGVPIYAPVKDSSQINPWTLVIRRILKSPYTIISQTTLELSADADKYNSESADKEVFLQEDEEESKFNAVVPVFSPEVAGVLKPLLRTNIFAMLSTFCILKNPHIVDHNAHLAGLGCVWIKMITDYPKANRPEFATNLISMIQATAKIYIDSESVERYLNILVSDPASALMTECFLSGMEDPLRCESLVKPLFLLYLMRKKPEVKSRIPSILPLLITEFFGRCIPAYSNRLPKSHIFATLFVPELRTPENRSDSAKEKLSVVCGEIIREIELKKGNFVANYYLLFDLIKDVKTFSEERRYTITGSSHKIELNTDLINNFKSPSSAGNFKLNAFMSFAEEVGLEEISKEIFTNQKMLVYLIHALDHRASRDRMRVALPSEGEARDKVERMVKLEEERFLKASLTERVVEEATHRWREEFLSIHSTEVILPLTKREVIQAASKRGIDVNEENFRKTYRYRPETGLLRNACMVEGCPFFLAPRKDFNQHIALERKAGHLHQMHQVALDVAMKGGDEEQVVKILLAKRQGRLHQKDLPPMPSPQNLEALKKGIGRLLTSYSKFNS